MITTSMEKVTVVEERDFVLEYYRALQKNKEDSTAHLYGICIAKYINGVLADKNCSGAISDKKDYVDNIISTLANGIVTPMVLNEILDDILCGHSA